MKQIFFNMLYVTGCIGLLTVLISMLKALIVDIFKPRRKFKLEEIRDRNDKR